MLPLVRGAARTQRHSKSISWLARLSSSASTQHSSSILDSLRNYEQQGMPAGSGTPASSTFDLGRMHRLLAALGNPHTRFPVVHVAGSKGKGSTATMISSILRSCGFTVGLYTSPHLHSITERICVHGRPITRQALETLEANHGALIAKQQEADGGALSHFEALTALALRHFADREVNVAVVEVGMGGALDATNVFDEQSLAAAVITPLGYEHVAALGGTIESIAAAKAGIMKRGRPVIVAEQSHMRAMDMLNRTAGSLGCSMVHAQEQVQAECTGHTLLDTPSISLLRSSVTLRYKDDGHQAQGAHVSIGPAQAGATSQQDHATIGSSGATSSSQQAAADEGDASTEAAAADRRARSDSSSMSTKLGGSKESWRQLGPFSAALTGHHQMTNMCTAVACCLSLRAQGWAVSDAALQEGLEAARLPGRVQVLRLAPPVAMGDLAAGSTASDGSQPAYNSKGPLLVLDGAHTRESAASLVSAVRTAFPAATHPLVLVVAMAEDKDAREVLGELRSLQPKAVIFTTVPIAGSYYRSAAPGALAAQWQAAGMLTAGDPARRLRGCRELIQASLGAAYAKAKNELAGHTALPGQQQSGGDRKQGEAPQGVLVVTGSLHAVAATQQLEEVAEQLARAVHHDQ